MVLSLLKQNAATLARFIDIFKASSTSTVCRKEGSSEIMIMKSSKVKKIVVSIDSDSMHTEQATTSSDMLSFGQPVNGRFKLSNLHKIQSQST